jgi:polyphosphate:AMP phosphotransferase
VGELEWKHFELYDEFAAASVRALRETSTGNAPWTIVEGTDRRYRELTVGTSVLGALAARLQRPADAPVANTRAAPLIPALDGKNVLSALDYTTRMPREEYERELEEKQGRLNLLTRRPRFEQHSVVVVFEGSDAAGKGGAVRRLTRALDARQYQVVPIAAPTDEERARPYLWRFWRHLPERGRFTVFDRSWYGRVLVERVEGYCSQSDWMRAYTEINDFEEQLVKNNTIVVKIWLQITAEEQLRRFEERKNTPFKQHKITEDDWRNRAKADEYTQAVCDMIDRTSTELAPWNLIPADDKLSARIRVLDVIHRSIREALE